MAVFDETNCKTCRYKALAGKNEWCYMFREMPVWECKVPDTRRWMPPTEVATLGDILYRHIMTNPFGVDFK